MLVYWLNAKANGLYNKLCFKCCISIAFKSYQLATLRDICILMHCTYQHMLKHKLLSWNKHMCLCTYTYVWMYHYHVPMQTRMSLRFLCAMFGDSDTPIQTQRHSALILSFAHSVCCERLNRTDRKTYDGYSTHHKYTHTNPQNAGTTPVVAQQQKRHCVCVRNAAVHRIMSSNNKWSDFPS